MVQTEDNSVYLSVLAKLYSLFFTNPHQKIFIINNFLCDSENQKLYLSSDLTKQNLERVFIHELLHSIQMDRCLDLGEDAELIIDEMAKGLHQVINDNLGLFVKTK